jgi:hypothetical protein
MAVELILTKEDLLIAAERAAVYPPGYGNDWGHGPMAENNKVVDVKLCEHPEWLPYG